MTFSTVFQSYQDNGWVIMKDYVQCNGSSFMVERLTPGARLEPELLDQ